VIRAKRNAGYLRHGFIAHDCDDAHVALAVYRQLKQGPDVLTLGPTSLVAAGLAYEQLAQLRRICLRIYGSRKGADYLAQPRTVVL
jgi:hypothetical protein